MFKLISVIIPCYNSEKTLERAIRSVLNQSYKNLELILVDDGSSDNTREIALSYIKRDCRIKYCYINNSGGPSRPSNYGVNVSSGDLVAFLDHDDEWLPEKLERQVLLLNEKKLDFVSCFGCFFDSERGSGLKIIIDKKTNYREASLKNNFIMSLSSVVIRKSAFIDVGMFDERLKGMQDWDLYIRLFTSGFLFGFVDSFLYYTFKQKESLSVVFSRNKFIAETNIIYNKNKQHYSRELSSRFFRSLGVLSQSLGDSQLARNYFCKSIGARFNLFSYFLFFLSFLGKIFFNYTIKIKVIIKFAILKLIKYF